MEDIVEEVIEEKRTVKKSNKLEDVATLYVLGGYSDTITIPETEDSGFIFISDRDNKRASLIVRESDNMLEEYAFIPTVQPCDNIYNTILNHLPLLREMYGVSYIKYLYNVEIKDKKVFEYGNLKFLFLFYEGLRQGKNRQGKNLKNSKEYHTDLFIIDRERKIFMAREVAVDYPSIRENPRLRVIKGGDYIMLTDAPMENSQIDLSGSERRSSYFCNRVLQDKLNDPTWIKIDSNFICAFDTKNYGYISEYADADPTTRPRLRRTLAYHYSSKDNIFSLFLVLLRDSKRIKLFVEEYAISKDQDFCLKVYSDDEATATIKKQIKDDEYFCVHSSFPLNGKEKEVYWFGWWWDDFRFPRKTKDWRYSYCLNLIEKNLCHSKKKLCEPVKRELCKELCNIVERNIVKRNLCHSKEKLCDIVERNVIKQSQDFLETTKQSFSVVDNFAKDIPKIEEKLIKKLIIEYLKEYDDAR